MASRLAFSHRPGRRQAQRLADQAAFAEELALREDRDHGFLALLRLDHDLDPAFLDVEDRVRRAGLRKYDGILGVRGDHATVMHGGEKRLRIEGRLGLFCQGRVLCRYDQVLRLRDGTSCAGKTGSRRWRSW